MEKQPITTLLDIYREAALGTSAKNPDDVNISHDKMHACYKRLRQTVEGRNGISNLMSDASPHVRLWAAAHALAWVPEDAQKALVALRDSNGPGAFDAGITLDEFYKGSLTFDYE